MRLLLRLLLPLAAVVFTVAGLAQARLETGVDSFLPSTDPSVQEYENLARSFGGDAIVVLVEGDQPGKLLSPARLPDVLKLEGELSRLEDVARTYGPASTLNQIAGQAQNLLAELVGRRDGMLAAAQRAALARGVSEAGARRAGEDAVAAFDKRYGPLIVQGLPVGLPTLRNQKFVDNVLYNPAGEPRPQWRYLVPDARSVAILVRPREALDQEATERLVRAVRDTVDRSDLGDVRTTVVGSPAIVAGLGEQTTREAPVLGIVAVVSIGACLLLLPWARRRLRLVPLGVTLVAGALTVAVLGWLDHPITLGVVAFLPVLAGLGCYYTAYLLRGARTGVVVVVAASTSLSMATLMLSPLAFVRDLGITFALGIAFAAGLGWVVSRRLGSQLEPEAAGPIVMQRTDPGQWPPAPGAAWPWVWRP